ncbi:MAG: calcium/sodium antiporter [Candidatus Omnitrophica bacterium]|nr:calcium/sodium antiporter [Candidatus Omnitrophota bacterium]MBU1524518.1 calcium/sodium antiporter [Candidatus Omnitrophota bacterium]MBU1811038.1 calcium/sodium antiporter [Candidatus Omnitrophota bacterium]
MEITGSFSLFIVGLFLLVLSANWLIQSCVKISFLLKLTPLFIGLVLVAFGTSAPEAGVGIMAAIKNQKAVALGTVIGSNIANIGLILGLCAFLTPLTVNKSIFKRELPIMIFSPILLYVLSLDLLLSRLDGLIFILSFLFFCFISYKGAKKSFDDKEAQNFKLNKSLQNSNSLFLIITIILFSLLGIILGADLMVRGGVKLARIFGISPWIVSITVFAIGTSLPELVASLTASLKKIPSISVGNVVGSNIFNILFILGIVALIRPISVASSVLKFEFPVLFLFSILLFTVMRTKYKITRKEGLVMFLGYLAFLFFLLRR